MIGVLAGNKAPINILPVLMNQIRIQGVFVGHREGLLAMVEYMALKQITPVVHQVYPFLESPEAFKALESGMHMSEICISFV